MRAACSATKGHFPRSCKMHHASLRLCTNAVSANVKTLYGTTQLCLFFASKSAAKAHANCAARCAAHLPLLVHEEHAAHQRHGDAVSEIQSGSSGFSGSSLRLYSKYLFPATTCKCAPHASHAGSHN